MSDKVVRPASPSPSISLLEIKAETRLVLKSLLRHSLSIPQGERPGRIGGAYNDPNKFSASLKEKGKKDANGWDSLDEEISAAEEKKHGIKNFIKRRLRNRSSMIHRAKKDGSTGPTQIKTESGHSDIPGSLRGKSEEERLSPSSASEEEGHRKVVEQEKKKKKKLRFSEILKKVSFKKEEPRPQRPDSLSFKAVSPSHPPEFYDGVADTLERIAQKHSTKKRCEGRSPVKPGPVSIASEAHPPEFYDGVADTLERIAQKHSTKKRSPVKPGPVSIASEDKSKEAVVQQLVQILTSEGDAINDKINANPFLRSTLTRLSYPSFAKLLEAYASESEEPPLNAPVSPTLRRLAITMDASRRVITATGAQLLTGHAQRYMESFAPWVRSHGGWENVVHLSDNLEYD